MLGRFIRKPEVIAISGLGYSMFHEALKNGDFPPPDTYLGERSPVWTSDTIRAWQERKLAEPKRPKARTPRRRKTAP